jgi:lipopolysaccharide/colanic/teichoic acid biosynthesis glycosyltransferase
MDLVLQAPSIALDKTKQQTVIASRQILRIDSCLFAPEHESGQGSVSFSSVSLRDAINTIRENDNGIDAILINPASLTDDFQRLKEAARRKAVPIIFYTPLYNEEAKKIAVSNSADDYHYGALSASFLKRLEFIKKLKAYKNQRGNKPYVLKAQEQAPDIQLWSLKRAFDIVVSGTALLLLSPICLLIAIIIKLESKGPIFYISKRAGTGYRIFDFYKFRSMRTGADDELKKLAHLNQYNENASTNVFFKLKNDPRVTKFGQFLRTTSLDEIPQLVNVLIGDMSLVGNRPLPLYEAEKLTKDQIAWRFLAPAGITGLWQITKRGKDNMSEDERIALDMEYAMKNSFLLDMKILFSTLPALLQKEKV